jgi:hypothetical protein
MNQTTDSSQLVDLKQKLLESVNDTSRFISLLKEIPLDWLTDIQNYFWDYLLTLARENGHSLKRDEITKRMITNFAYQRLVGCKEHEETCRAKICFLTNPNCAGIKIKMHINTLREMILEYSKSEEEL